MSAAEPAFLTRTIVDQLHSRSLELFGGMAGVRDEGLVESALASAENTWLYGRGDLFDIATAYAEKRMVKPELAALFRKLFAVL